MASGQRRRRVNEAIRHVLAEAVGRELSDPRLEMVTVTDVRASADVREATVFFTTLDPARRERSLRALEAARGLLQSRVGAALGTKNTPQLRFVYDDHQDEAMRLTRLIDEAASEVAARERDGDGDGGGGE
ncbi:MAG: 30S ribosome-binding factor RbfA [Actinomycetota bacterium]